MDDISTIGFRADLKGINQINTGLDKISTTSAKTEKVMGKSMSNVGRSAGQAGIQIQQLVGQVQGGVNPMLALSQQAADLGIVLGAPLVGVVTALSASLGMVLLPSLFDSTSETERLTDVLESLDKVVNQNAAGVPVLSNEIARLAKVSKEAANAQIALSITEATESLTIARRSADEAIESFDDFFNGFDTVATTETIENLNETLERTGLTTKQLLEETDLYATGLGQLSSFAGSLGEQFGTTTEESVSLIRAVESFRSGGSITDLAKQFTDVSLATDNETQALQSLVVNLNELSLTSEKSEAVLKLLESAIGNLDGALGGADTAVNELIKSYKIKTEALGKTDAQAALYITTQKLGIDESDKEYASIKKVIDAYYSKVDALKETKKAHQDSTTALSVESVLAYQQYGAAMLEASKIQKEQIGISDDLYFAYTQYADAMIAAQDVQNDAPDPDDYFNSIIDGSLEAAAGLQSLADVGTDAYNDLTVAAMALQAAQQLSSGNFIGATITGLSAISTMLGGEIEDLSKQRQEAQGLNKFGEKADSIAVATDITANATEDLVGINTDMLRALNTLQNSIGSAASIIAGDIDIPQVSVDTTSILDDVIGLTIGVNDLFTDLLDFGTGAFDFLDDIFGSLMGAIGGILGGDSKVVDEGIQIIGGELGDLMNETMVLAFQSVSARKNILDDYDTYTDYDDITDEVGSQFALVFASMADAVYAGATTLGLDSKEVEKAIQEFTIDTITISLHGLSAEDQAAEIEAVFSDIFNDLAEEVVPWLDELQDAGEELGETLARVATQVSIADHMVSVFGITFGDKMADPEAYAKAADNLAELVGGVENLSSTTAAFIDSFATDEQQLEILGNALNESLSAVGLTLPTTAEGMWDLMSSLDGSTEAGQEQIAALLLATETADAYYQILGRTQQAMADLSDSLASTVMDIYDVSDGIEQISLDAALAAARMGDFTLAEQLDPNEYDLDEADFSNITDYQIAQAEAANKLIELSELAADSAGDVETQQLDELKSINMNLTKALEETNQLMRTQNRLQADAVDNLDEINNIGVKDRDGLLQ